MVDKLTEGHVKIPVLCVPVGNFNKFGIDGENLDQDGDHYVCFHEAYNRYISPKHGKLQSELFAKLFSKCDDTFDSRSAALELSGLRGKIAGAIERVSKPFGEGQEAARASFQYALRMQELKYLRDTFDIAKKKGTGQLGLSWFTPNGVISSVRTDSTAEAAGVKVGDRIVSINGIVYNPSPETRRAVLEECFGKCGEKVTLTVERNGLSKTFVIPKGPY